MANEVVVNDQTFYSDDPSTVKVEKNRRKKGSPGRRHTDQEFPAVGGRRKSDSVW